MRIGAALAVCAVALSCCTWAANPHGLDFSNAGVYAVSYDWLDFAYLKLFASGDPDKYARSVSACKQRGQFVAISLYTWDRVTHKTPLEKVFKDTDTILDALDLEQVDLIFLNEEEVDWQGGFDYLNAIYDHVKGKFDGPVYQWYSVPMGPRCDQKADGWALDAYGMDHNRFRKHLMRFIVIDKPVIVCINATPGVNSLECSREQLRVCQEFNIPVFYYCVHGPMGSVNMYFSTDIPRVARWRSWFFDALARSHLTNVARLPAESAQHSFADSFELAGDGSGTFSFVDDYSADSFLTRSTIHGFLHLAWSSLDRAVCLKPAKEPVHAELIYQFTTPFGFVEPRIKASGTGRLAVAASADGRAWSEAEIVLEDGLTVASTALPEMKGKNLWVRVQLAAEPGQEIATILDRLVVEGGFEPPASSAFELIGDLQATDRPKHLSLTRVDYEDGFDAQRYLHVGQVDNPGDLTWSPGTLSITGVQGRTARVEVKQHFTSREPLGLDRIALDCVAYANFGAHDEIGVSLDGLQVLASETTAGKERASDKRFYGELELDLTSETWAQGVTDFWVHMVMVNNCGKKTNTTNQLKRLVVQGKAARED